MSRALRLALAAAAVATLAACSDASTAPSPIAKAKSSDAKPSTDAVVTCSGYTMVDGTLVCVR